MRIWLHTAMVEHEGEKMSKSLGNLVMVRDLLNSGRRTRSASISGALLSPPVEPRSDQLASSPARAPAPGRRHGSGGEGDPHHVADAEADFTAAMNDDLNSPSALARLAALADDVVAAARAGRRVEAGQALVRRLAHVFGPRLDRLDTEDWVTRGWDAHLRRFPSL